MNNFKKNSNETKNITEPGENLNNYKNKNVPTNTKNIINKSNPPQIHLKYFKDLATDSFSYYFNNSFCIFESINKILYLIHANQKFSIISYNLIQFQKINEIKNAHCSDIIGFRHYCDKKNKRDLIISISTKDNNVKLWDINNFELLLNFQNINKKGRINSACFLNNNSDIYIISSNYNLLTRPEPIKVFDLNGNLVQLFDTENENIVFVDVYYDKILSMNFIISCGYKNVKSYDFNGGILYNKYLDVEKNRYNSFFIDDSENEIKIISPNTLGCILIWNFHSGELISKIGITERVINDICKLDNKYCIIGGEITLKIVEIKNCKNHKDLINTKGSITAIKTIIHPYYGECLIIQDSKGKIILYTLNYS